MMEDGIEKKEGIRQEIYSKPVRAGKRTYFLDVKATRRNDYYLTITESKKRFNREGRYFFEKHKIFLYKEDFEKFIEGLHEVIDYIKTANPQPIEIDDDHDHDRDHDSDHEHEHNHEHEQADEDQDDGEMAENFTDIDFDELGDTKKS